MYKRKTHYQAVTFSRRKGHTKHYAPCGAVTLSKMSIDVGKVTCKKCLAWIKRIDSTKLILAKPTGTVTGYDDEADNLEGQY